MTKKVEAIQARQISVNCVPNDPVDVKCGGPHYLGFDFYVDADEDMDTMVEFIKGELKRLNKALDGNILVGDTHLVEKPWTREMITECIEKDNEIPTVGSHQHERSLRGYR